MNIYSKSAIWELHRYVAAMLNTSAAATPATSEQHDEAKKVALQQQRGSGSGGYDDAATTASVSRSLAPASEKSGWASLRIEWEPNVGRLARLRRQPMLSSWAVWATQNSSGSRIR